MILTRHEALGVTLCNVLLIRWDFQHPVGQQMSSLRLVLLSVQVAMAIGVILPLIFHSLLNRYWMGLPPLTPPVTKREDLPKMTVVLPVWNEALVIEGKLADIAAQDYPDGKLDLLVIDSASTDDTLKLTRKWLAEHPDAFAGKVQIIEMLARLGKSAAVVRALEELSDDCEVVVFSDAECRISAGSLLRIGRWFTDPAIGAVCGCLSSGNPAEGDSPAGGGGSAVGDEASYREIYHWFREGESRRFSTPILEGSIAAYRREALPATGIVTGANADDSQMGMLVTSSGLRAILDPQITFGEPAVTDAVEERERKVRRAQGLVRHFWRSRKVWFRSSNGWGTIVGLNGFIHVILPWMVLLGVLAGVGHILDVILAGWFVASPTLLDRVMLLVDAVVMLLLAAGLAGLRFRLASTTIAFVSHIGMLLEAQVRLMRGQSMHMWSPAMSVRRKVAELEYDAEK